MDPIVALLVVALLVVLGGAIGLLQRRRSGRSRRTRRTGAISAAELGVATLGTTATVVQFSTEYCSRCPAVRRALAGLVAVSGASIAFTDVDLTHRPETAERFRVLQTPTVLVLDHAGVETARFSGAVRPELVRTALADLEGAPRADRIRPRPPRSDRRPRTAVRGLHHRRPPGGRRLPGPDRHVAHDGDDAR